MDVFHIKGAGNSTIRITTAGWQPPKMSESDMQLLQAVKSLAAPKETTNNTSDSAKQTTIPQSKEQER